MLEDKLNLVPSPKGKTLEGPHNVNELSGEYFLAGHLSAKPHDGYDPSQDIGRVLTLRPNVSPPYITTRVKQAIHRGYFAWGRQEGGGVIFDIFVPHSCVRSIFPPKQLESAVNLFAARLRKEGYDLQTNPIKYTTSII